MKLIVSVAAVLAGVTAAGSTAAPESGLGSPRTLVTTRTPIRQFAQDGNWVAWSTSLRACGASLSMYSLRSHRRVTIPHARRDGFGCGAYGGLALARNRVMWMVFTGAGNTELDVAVMTATFSTRKPRRVQEMAMERDAYEAEPSVPPLAGRGSLLTFYRHEDGIGGPRTHAVERVAGRSARRVFRFDDPRALAVDGGRVAAVRRQLVRGDACNCNFDPAWSPDGTKVALISGEQCCVDDDETADLYVMNADGTGRIRITSDARPKYGVAWSPDGTKLAYGYYESSYRLKLAIVNADGSARHDVGDGIRPSWSPDGTKLAFDDQRYHVLVANADGSGAHQVAAGVRPAWSPDGTRIAYDDAHGALFTVRADGGDPRRVADGMSEAAWSPDGAKIAGAAHDGIWVARADGSGHIRLPNTERGDGNPSWSPGGTAIAFDSLRNDLDGNVYAEPELYSTPAGGGEVKPLTYTKPDEWTSPLQVRSLYGRLLSSYTAFGEPLGIALSGRYVATLTRAVHTGELAITVVNAGSGKLIRTSVVQSSATGSISASGGRLVYAAGRTVRLLNLASGKSHLLAFTRGPVVGAAISGRRVTWAEQSGKGGRIRTILLSR